MDNIPAYIRRKHGQEPVTYLHPLLEPYLEKTYGIFVYQEDIMSAAIALGGFTGPEADTLGYAIRKKKSAVLRAQKEKFVTQAAERGVPAADDRRGLHRLRAVRALRLQQGPRHLLRPDRLPDRLPQGELHGRVHDRVLTAFRSNEEKVAAAVAECRRLGIEVLPPDVHRATVEFTVEGEAIRFGLLAVKNVGQGAIESIIAAREEGGPFRSLTDFCTRIDLRLCNRKVLESLVKVGALDAFGHPAQILLGLDDAMAAAQATQRDRITGQTSLFDLGAADADGLRAAAARRPPRSRCASGCAGRRSCWACTSRSTRWARSPSRSAQFVTAYSGDLKDESLDGQRIVVGGIVTGIRTVVTKAQATRWRSSTIEDLQGTIEVVVFPRLYETDRPTWRDGAILLVAGRVDHRGEEVSLLADLVAGLGRGRRRSGRRRSPGRSPPATAGRAAGRQWPPGSANGNGNGSGGPRPIGRGRSRGGGRCPVAAGAGVGHGPAAVPFVSPLRVDARRRHATPGSISALPPIAPAEPISAYVEADSVAASPPTATRSRRCPTRRASGSWPRRRPTPRSTPVPDAILHVRFAGSAASDRVVSAMELVKRLLRDRPGATRVVIHLPASGAGGRRCRWSCAAASPTTPSCWRRSTADSATGSWSCAWPRPDANGARREGACAAAGAAGQSAPATRRTSWTADSFSW